MKAATSRGLDYIFNLFISIHAAREGGDSVKRVQQLNRDISIHAAREGGDTPQCRCKSAPIYFNPRRP